MPLSKRSKYVLAALSAAAVCVVYDASQLRSAGFEDITIGEGISRATSVEVAVHYLRAGRAVALELFDASPTVVSEQIMAASLEQGLGILSNGVGPAQRCLSERAGWAFYLAITSEEAVMVYDPEGNAVTVLHLQADMPLAFFLRGNV